MKKLLVLTSFIVLMLAVGYFLLNKNKSEPVNPIQNQNPKPTPTQIVGEDRDANGCIGSAGYSWCESRNKCLRVLEEPCYTSVEQEVQSFLAKKYNRSTDEVKITIIKQDGDYVSGSVLFGAGGPGEGGIFLARKVGDAWEVVFDGNGSIDCNKMRQDYKFPDTILKPNFCD